MSYRRVSRFAVVTLFTLLLILVAQSINAPSYAAVEDLKSQALKINEIENNPAGPERNNQWIELFNTSGVMLDISDWLVKSTRLGKTFTIPNGFVIMPNDYLVTPLNSVLLGVEHESVLLLTPDFVEVDRTPLLSDTVDDDLTWQRFPNGKDTNSVEDWSLNASTHARTNGVPVVRESFRLSPPIFINQDGGTVQSITAGRLVGVKSSIINELPIERSMAYVLKISNEQGETVHVSWVEDLIIPSNRTVNPTAFWLTGIRGNFLVETFVWTSMALPEPLTSPQIGILRIAG